MPRLIWSANGERFYETGLDRGVLYVEGQPGVVWNGLKSVSENPSGGEGKSYYVDGVKYLIVSDPEEFGASIEAFTYPDAFSQCDGTAVVFSGVYIGQQRRKSFGLSYRTLVGNDIEGVEHGYKIHLIYGAVAEPSDRSYSSTEDSPDPSSFSWSCTTKPVAVGNGFKPTSHIVIDSRKISPQTLQIVESRIYGTDAEQPYLPSPAELFELFTINPGMVFRLQLNTVTGLSLLVPEVPGDLQEGLAAGTFVLTASSHLSGGSDDGIYIWEA